MIVMPERGKPRDRRLGEGVGNSSATSCSTIKAQKDAGRRRGMRERRAFISLPLDPCQKRLAKCIRSYVP
jgi:hypothetical protein